MILKALVAAVCGSLALPVAGAQLVAQQPQRDTLLPGRTVDVTASEYAFRAPDTIPAGLVTFRLQQAGRAAGGAHLSPLDRQALLSHGGDATDGLHMLWVVRLDSGQTAADFYATQRAGADTPWAHLLGGPAFAFPPRTTNASMSLVPGNYVLVCFVGAAREDRRRYHLLKGMFRPLTVVATDAAMEPLPAPDATVTIGLSDSVTWSIPAMKGGTRRLLVRNRSGSRVEFTIARVRDGHTAAEAIAWRRRDGTPPVVEPWGGVVGLAHGDSMLTTLDLVPGTYVANRVGIVVIE
jgi:hypothetical protein